MHRSGRALRAGGRIGRERAGGASLGGVRFGEVHAVLAEDLAERLAALRIADPADNGNTVLKPAIYEPPGSANSGGGSRAPGTTEAAIGEALQAATRTGGEIMQRGHELGLVKEGYLADLLLVDGDPLANIKELGKVEFVMKDGQVFKNEVK